MEDLNAQQIVLLTLLVSFITSIATGITTVSLLEQAPEPVTQTINRVVERTVEKVVVEDENDEPVERIIETVVVNEGDLTIEAVSKNSANLVRIYSVAGDVKNFITLGVLVSPEGKILTDSKNIISSGVDYVAETRLGEFNLTVDFRELNNPFALLSTISDGSTFSSAIFGDSATVQLGQTVIALSGQSNDIVTTGIVNSIETVDLPEGGTEVSLFDTSVDSSKILTGAILLNLNGEIVGAKINGDPARAAAFIPVNQMKDFLSSQSVVAVEAE